MSAENDLVVAVEALLDAGRRPRIVTPDGEFLVTAAQVEDYGDGSVVAIYTSDRVPAPDEEAS